MSSASLCSDFSSCFRPKAETPKAAAPASKDNKAPEKEKAKEAAKEKEKDKPKDSGKGSAEKGSKDKASKDSKDSKSSKGKDEDDLSNFKPAASSAGRKLRIDSKKELRLCAYSADDEPLSDIHAFNPGGSVDNDFFGDDDEPRLPPGRTQVDRENYSLVLMIHSFDRRPTRIARMKKHRLQVQSKFHALCVRLFEVR